MSPCLKVGFGLGYVKPEYAKPGTEIAVVIREKPCAPSGEDPVRLTCPAGLHSGLPGSGMF